MRGISWLAAKPVSFSKRTLLHAVSPLEANPTLLFPLLHYSPTRIFASLMNFYQSPLVLTSPVLTLNYYQQFHRSLPQYPDYITPNATKFQQTSCKFHSAGHVHMRESKSKDCQFEPHDYVRVLSSENGWKNSMPFSYFLLSRVRMCLWFYMLPRPLPNTTVLHFHHKSHDTACDTAVCRTSLNNKPEAKKKNSLFSCLRK